MRPALTAAADRAAAMPAAAPDRLDRIAAALRSLDSEQRRLERLGFELPLARCHEERRYWRFLDAVHRIAAGEPDVRGSW